VEGSRRFAQAIDVFLLFLKTLIGLDGVVLNLPGEFLQVGCARAPADKSRQDHQ